MDEYLEKIINANFNWQDQMLLEEAFADIDRPDDESEFCQFLNKNYNGICYKIDAHLNSSEPAYGAHLFHE